MGSKTGVQLGTAVVGAVAGAFIGQPHIGWYAGASLGATLGGAAGGIAGGMIYPPPKPETKIRQIKSAVGTSAVEGVPVHVIFGRTRVGANVMFKSDITRHESTQTVSSSRGGGKGGGGGGGGGSTETTTTTTWFTADFVMSLGEGPIILHNIYEGKNIVDIAHTFYPGSFTQEADDFLTSKTGKAVAYRGTSYVVFRDYNLGSSSTIPALTFEVEGALHSLGISSDRKDAETNNFSWNPGVVTSNGLGSSLIQNGYLRYNNRDYIPGWTTYSGSNTSGVIYNRTDNIYNDFPSLNGNVNITDAGDYIACTTLGLTNSIESLNIKFFNSALTEIGNESIIATVAGSLPYDIYDNVIRTPEESKFTSSPVGYTAYPYEIDIPSQAYEFTIYPSSSIYISTDSSMSSYDKVYARSKEVFPCGRLSKIYIKGEDNSGTAHIKWSMLSTSGDTTLLGLGSGRGTVSQVELYWNGVAYEELDSTIVREENVTLVAVSHETDLGFCEILARTQNYSSPSTFGSVNQFAGFPIESSHAWITIARIYEDIKEVLFFEYEDCFILLFSNGSVYRLNVSLLEDYDLLVGPWKTLDYDSSYIKINTNDLETSYVPEIGSASVIGAIIYVGYTDGTASVNTGKIKYFDLITNSWSDTLYSTAAVVNKNPSSLESQPTNTYHVPLYHDRRTLYYGKNDTSDLDKWKIYKTRDNFTNSKAIENYEHHGTSLYKHNDYLYRPLGISGTTSELGSGTFNDIIYSHGAGESYSMVVGATMTPTIHELITTAEVVDDIITSERYGGDFNRVTNFVKAKNDCLDEKYYMNVAITEKNDLASLVGTASAHGWVSTIFSGRGIKLLISKDEDVVTTIGEAHLVGTGTDKSLRIDETSNSERINRLEIEFTDPNKAYSQRPVMVEDIADQQINGIDKTSISLPGFVDKEVVKHVGNIMLRSALYSRRGLSFTLGPEHLDLEVGDPVTLHFPNANINWLRARVQLIEEKTDFNLSVSCKEEPDYIFDPVDYTVPAPLAAPEKPYASGLSNIVGFTIKETPFELLTDTGVLELALLYGVGHEDTIGVDLYYSTDSGISYKLLLESRHHPPVGVLKSEMDSDHWLDNQTVEVDISGIPSENGFVSSTRNEMFSGINSIIIDDEYMMVQDADLVSTDTYEFSNFIRGRHGTETTTHLVGSTVYQMANVDHFTLGKGKIGTNLFFKAVPINIFKNEIDISEIEPWSMTVQGKAHRPHPPSSVQLFSSGVHHKSAVISLENDITITWSLVNKQTGFGRQGFGYAVKEGTPIGEEYVDIIIENWYNGSLVRTTFAGATETSNVYTAVENIADNGSLSSPIEFKVFSRGAYGRSVASTDISIDILSVM